MSASSLTLLSSAQTKSHIDIGKATRGVPHTAYIHTRTHTHKVITVEGNVRQHGLCVPICLCVPVCACMPVCSSKLDFPPVSSSSMSVIDPNHTTLVAQNGPMTNSEAPPTPTPHLPVSILLLYGILVRH
jgi:hypothetical protein